MASLDRSTALRGLAECQACASGLARLPQPKSHSGTAVGQIRRLQASAFAPLVHFLGRELDVGRGKRGRPGILSDISADEYQVHLLATLTHRDGNPNYDAMPSLFKFFVLKIAHALGYTHVHAENSPFDAFHIHTCPEWEGDKEQYVVTLPFHVPTRGRAPWTGQVKQGSSRTRVSVDTGKDSDLDRLKALDTNLVNVWRDAAEKEPEAVDAMIEEFEAFMANRSNLGSVTPSVVSPYSTVEGPELPQTPTWHVAGDSQNMSPLSSDNPQLKNISALTGDQSSALESSLFAPAMATAGPTTSVITVHAVPASVIAVPNNWVFGDPLSELSATPASLAVVESQGQCAAQSYPTVSAAPGVSVASRVYPSQHGPEHTTPELDALVDPFLAFPS